MNHLVPIQITLQAANAADARQLVQDLAGTMTGMPNNDVPATTEVSTLPSAAPMSPPQAQPSYQAPTVPISSPGGFPGQPTPQQQQQQQPAPQAPTQPEQAYSPPTGQVPTSVPSYSLDQLGVAAGPLVDAGKGPEMTAWLQQHGAQALTQLNPALYGEFATYLRSMGAKI